MKKKVCVQGRMNKEQFKCAEELFEKIEISQRLNKRELCAIKSMLVYQGFVKKLPESYIEEFFCSEFNIDKPEDLHSDQFNCAMAYLVDWEVPLFN